MCFGLLVRWKTSPVYHALSYRLFRGTEEPVPAVVTDVVMPGMSGPQLAREIRQSGSKAKILFISGYVDSLAHEDIPRGEGYAYLQKPFRPGELVRKLRELLDN